MISYSSLKFFSYYSYSLLFYFFIFIYKKFIRSSAEIMSGKANLFCIKVRVFKYLLILTK